MLKTVKSKIIFITVAMLLSLAIVLLFFAYNSYKTDKQLKTESCDLMIVYFAEEINKAILQHQENVKDLALMGEIYYRFAKVKDISAFIVKKNFENNKHAIGGGIWFEPYVTNRAKIRNCSYAYRNIDGKVIIDESFESGGYNYLTQNWYLYIKKNLSEKNSVIWTEPYFDGTGTYSLMTTVGAGIYDENNKNVGMATVDWQLGAISQKISKMRPTKNSFALFADEDKDFIIAINDSSIESDKLIGKSLSQLKWYKNERKDKEEFLYNGIKYISFVKKLDNEMILIVNVPEKELFEVITRHLKIMSILLILSSFIISIMTFWVLKRNINKPIDYLTKIAAEIGNGNLDAEIKLDKPEEFANLATSFNKMTKDIKKYIMNLNIAKMEKEKMESELAIAKSIQYSVLPNVFPPYPDYSEFDIYATMDTAKEVGGDFYDFFFVDPNHLMFLIADVSGKGIPAALFMMTTKTLIKNLAKTNLSPQELMNKINRKICKTNEQGFFITIFVGILELSSGKLICINGGHNPPLIRKNDGSFEYFKCKSNLVLGAMNDFRYESCETKLNRGDSIFLYTDGITEATNLKGEMYGEERLSKVLNFARVEDNYVEEILKAVKNDVEVFSNGAELFDDMTMLILQYNGLETDMKQEKEEKLKTKKFLLPADVDRLDNVTKWLEETCDDENIPENCKMKLTLAVEEIFVNISNYAYPPKKGDVEIVFKINNGKQVELQFIDYGTPYNPLEKPDPDITLSAEDRPIGGLGIFMVKKSMDSMEYEFKDGKNILTVKLTF